MLRFKRNFILLSTAVLLSSIYSQPSYPQQSVSTPLSLAWNRNTESDLQFYRIYWRKPGEAYKNDETTYMRVDREPPSCTLCDYQLTVDETYYIALTAFDSSFNESGYSNELYIYVESSQPCATTTSPYVYITTTTTPPTQNVYCSTDDTLILHGSIPEEGTISVTLPDDLGNAISATLFLTLWDPDISGEGYIYINGNDPIDLPVDWHYDNLEYSFEVPINLNWLVQGENTFRFTHVSTWGYEVRTLCVQILFSTSPITTTIPSYPTTVPIPPSTTTSTPPDETPPTGTVIINNGDAITSAQLVTLHLSAEDDESGMGEGAQMKFSNDNTRWSSPESFAPTKDWMLLAGGGVKTVYVKFCDSMGNWMSQPASDSIVLDSLACLKPSQLDTTAIESSGDSIPFWPKENAVDGKTDTGWLSTLRFLFMQEEYLTIDLGETKIVNRIDTCSNPFLFFDLFPSDFKIQVSTDNEEWVEVFSEKDYSSPSSHTNSWVFEETEARYIKMVITKAKSFLLLFYLTYIAEINVHGCEKTDTLSSMTLFDGTKARVVKLTPAVETPDEKESSPNNQPPGTPGKPVFILNNHP